MGMIFWREEFAEIELVLSSLEPLGVLDTIYLEDAFGLDGYISLHHVSSGVNVSVPMSPIGTGNVNFRGFVLLSSLQNGVYQIRGRVRDEWGNHTILSAVNNPAGGERVLGLGFEIRAGAGISICAGTLQIVGVRALGSLVVQTSGGELVWAMPMLEPVMVAVTMQPVTVLLPQLEPLEIKTRCA
jgi:hypothetical protein